MTTFALPQSAFEMVGPQESFMDSPSSYFHEASPMNGAFIELVRSRKQYLGSLRSLGDNWVSGSQAQSPADVAISGAMEFLDLLCGAVYSKRLSEPRMIMSPAPDGSVGIQLNYQNGDSIDILFHPDQTITLEWQKAGKYEEAEDIPSARQALETIYQVGIGELRHV